MFNRTIDQTSAAESPESIMNIIFKEENYLYHSLSLFAKYPLVNIIKKNRYNKQLKRNYKKLRTLNDFRPEFCLNKLYLVRALIAQINNDFDKAIKFYDKSISAAGKNRLEKEGAIAGELAALLCLKMGNDELTGVYLNEARNQYLKCGSYFNVTNIDTHYSRFINPQAEEQNADSGAGINTAKLDTPLEALDLATVIKASHMISGEIIMERLLEQLMLTLIENAGAETMSLILEKDGGLFIESGGSANVKSITSKKSVPAEGSKLVPDSVINYVKRTLEPVVLNDAAHEGMFTEDPYITENNIRSVLCVPLVRQNEFKGIVYLENRLTAGAFTSGRIEIVKLLSTQATISLENSLLFQKEKQNEMELQLKNEEMEQQCEEIQAQYEEMEALNEELVSSSGELMTLNETLAIFKKFAEESGQGMGMTDLNGSITYVNPGLCEILGYTSPEMMIGEDLKKFYQKDIADRIWNEIIPKVKEGKEWVGELILVSQFDKMTPVIQSFFTIRDNCGSLLYIATIITDITERKRLEEQLFQSQKMDAVGRLAGGIAHDFNNLLTAIMGFSELILRDMNTEDPHYFDVKEILKAAERSATLTRQLLAFSRKQMLKPSNLDLNQVVQDMEKMLNRLVGEDVRLFTFLMDGLNTIRADRGQVEQIIMNLVLNARDAMPAGGTITIMTGNKTIDANTAETIPNSRPGNFICITIEDTGIGIDPQDIDMIFEPFFSTKDPDKGTGLGLSVVYGITAQHNGWINVKSTIGKGTRFNIYLPSIATAPAESEQGEDQEKIFRGSGERILLVEDQQEVLNFVTKALKGFGYIVIPATTGKSAITLFDKEDGNFDLVLTDVVLPDINGTQIISYVRNKKPGIPVIMSSGYTDQKSQWDIIRDKGYHFMEKPYSLNVLLKTIYDIINGSKS